MRIISFRKFKENCKYLIESWESDFDIDECDYDKPMSDEKWQWKNNIPYLPCKESNCPVLEDCGVYKK